jgi:hypothetical protein
MRLRNLLMLVAIFASLVALGCWDNRREMERVLEHGYDANALITAAQFQRTAPFAVDGWRPRFVEQSLSVDLQWQGRDGKTHIHRKVPVSERFERSIVEGQQVKLIDVPVKALDDDMSVPVLTVDAAARLDSLKTWLEGAGYIAVAGWLAAGGMTFWARGARRALSPVPAASLPARARQPVAIPGQRLLIGMMAFAVGAFLTYNATAIGERADDGGRSVEVEAQITSATGPPHTVQLEWKDGRGGVHHFGTLPISDEFWSKITRDGKIEERRTKIRVSLDDGIARPEIVDDAPGARWQTKVVLAGGIALLLIGAGCLLSAARTLRRG